MATSQASAGAVRSCATPLDADPLGGMERSHMWLLVGSTSPMAGSTTQPDRIEQANSERSAR